jgi:uncharacterized membrane-anchored protein
MPSRTRPAVMATKVPAATTGFWIAKLLTTGFGETTSDFFVRTIAPELAVGVTGLVLLGALVLQLRAQRCIPALYWFTVVMVAVFGTMAADVAHVGAGIPYEVSTAVFAVTLAIVFTAWYVSERTLSIHSIRTRRRELFYWAAVLSTFALGTAAGDLLAHDLGLGYLTSGLLFTGALLLPAIWWFATRRAEVAAFWTAYVLTRPVGASFADWLGVEHSRGGLGWGTGPVSLGLATLMVLVVVLFAVAGRPRSGRTLAPSTEPAGS